MAFQSEELQSFLGRFETLNLYPNYICRKTPESLATICQTDEIQGALFDGPGYKLYESCAQWIVATSGEVAKLLLNDALERSREWDIEIPQTLLSTSELASFPVQFGVDLLMELNWSRFSLAPMPRGAEMGLLHRDSPLLEFADAWVFDRTGPIKHWGPESPMCVLLSDKKIVACCEALVSDSFRASLGQVSTREEFRGRGYAKALISHFCLLLKERNLTPYYLVSSANTASVKLAESIGFQTVSTFFCVTPDAKEKS
jgi:ribosomal protein S18 acetylase RimI-like enzyme